MGQDDMLQLTTTTLYGHPVWDADSIEAFEEFLNKKARSSHVLFRGQNSNWPLLGQADVAARRFGLR